MKKYLKVLILAFLFSVAININAEEKNVEFEKKNINAMADLLNRSTVSKQVLQSNNDAAVQYYLFSKSLFDDAVEAYRRGDIKESGHLIKKSRVALIDAIEFANLRGAKKKKRSKHNYELLRKSADALMDALHRIDVEKDAQDRFEILSEKVKKKLSQTDRLYFQEKYKPAIDELSKVLQIIKAEISKMRSGDTLTRTLSFSSAKDEYLYEIDRNDTHFMLIDMFLSEKNDPGNLLAVIKNTIQSAKKLRAEAEVLASSFKHKEAIKVLEQSTQEIINVIRNTGVFIPD